MVPVREMAAMVPPALNNKVEFLGDGQLIETLRRILTYNFEQLDVLLITGSSKGMIETRLFLGYDDLPDQINLMTGKPLHLPYIKPLDR